MRNWILLTLFSAVPLALLILPLMDLAAAYIWPERTCWLSEAQQDGHYILSSELAMFLAFYLSPVLGVIGAGFTFILRNRWRLHAYLPLFCLAICFGSLGLGYVSYDFIGDSYHQIHRDNC